MSKKKTAARPSRFLQTRTGKVSVKLNTIKFTEATPYADENIPLLNERQTRGLRFARPW